MRPGSESLGSPQDRGTFTATQTDPAGSVAPGVAILSQNTETNAVHHFRSNKLQIYRSLQRSPTNSAVSSRQVPNFAAIWPPSTSRAAPVM